MYYLEYRTRAAHAMSLSIYSKRQAPLKAGEVGDASEKLQQDEYEYEYEYEEDAGLETGLGEATGKPPSEYYESEWETTTVRCCGAFCCVFLGVLVLSWVVHAIPVSTITDIPPFARSMIWMSIAHHTDPWKEAQGSTSPPPPAFGDGLGNFPDQLTV